MSLLLSSNLSITTRAFYKEISSEKTLSKHLCGFNNNTTLQIWNFDSKINPHLNPSQSQSKMTPKEKYEQRWVFVLRLINQI